MKSRWRVGCVCECEAAHACVSVATAQAPTSSGSKAGPTACIGFRVVWECPCGMRACVRFFIVLCGIHVSVAVQAAAANPKPKAASPWCAGVA